jgi:SAM-dependent methyltransferase
MNEAGKIFPVIQQYLTGDILDVGCGDKKVVPHAEGVDIRPLEGVDHVMDISPAMGLSFDKEYDVVFSSHCLEHVYDDMGVLAAWADLVKPGGKLILYLPDAKYYDNRANPDHLRSYEYEVFMRWFALVCLRMDVIEHGPHTGNGQYSFYLVAQKRIYE